MGKQLRKKEKIVKAEFTDQDKWLKIIYFFTHKFCALKPALETGKKIRLLNRDKT